MVSPAADLVLYNANVLTLDTTCPKGELIAIKDGRIVNISTNRALKEFTSKKTKVIDCHGKTVVPGFNDAHLHLLAFAESLLTLNLGLDSVRSISDIKNKIRRLSQNLPPGSWIRAGGYNEFYLEEKRHPTRWDLDQATTSHPVKLTHRSGHAHVLNSMALALTGISRETPEPPGGMIERDLDTGEPNGLLFGMDNYLARFIPPLSDTELTQGIKLANQELLARGITSIQDASPRNDLTRWRLFQQWKSQRLLSPRTTMLLGLEAFHQFPTLNSTPRIGGDHLQLGAVKIMIDETRGHLNPPQIELNQKVLTIHRSGFQVAFHAVEETTIEAACTALEYALANSPCSDHRHRIEHCSICPPKIVKRLASLNVIVVTQPSFIYYNGDRYLQTVSQDQLKYLYPMASLIKAGIKVAASSDCPVVPPDPPKGIYAAVSRMTQTGQSILPEERVSSLQALQLYTESAAYACFQENIKGTIAPGKLADLVILNNDPTKMALEQTRKLEVEITIIGGEIAWSKPSNSGYKVPPP
ncbi:MAG TPA: amidohydrolase [Dehalococcoidia bacterium]|nr:amidohydrolase [Dehalococcoidia bacterium]